MATYALDCAFDATVTPRNSEESVVMAYGYAYNGRNGWEGAGQAAKEMSSSDQIYFSVYDTSGTCTGVTVRVDFKRGHTAVPSQGASPLSSADTSTLGDGVSLTLNANDSSSGCNITGSGGSLGPYSF